MPRTAAPSTEARPSCAPLAARRALLLATAAVLLLRVLPAHAGPGRCRKVCKPFVADCVAAGGKPRRCRHAALSLCRERGPSACAAVGVTTTTTLAPPSTTTSTVPADAGTTTTTVAGTTTTTTMPPPPPGFLDFWVEDIMSDPEADPDALDLLVWFLGDADIQPVDLAPRHFSFRDADGHRWEAEPRRGSPDDCTARTWARPDTEVLCWVRFVLPPDAGVAARDQPGRAALWFENGGYAVSVPLSRYPDGGIDIGR